MLSLTAKKPAPVRVRVVQPDGQVSKQVEGVAVPTGRGVFVTLEEELCLFVLPGGALEIENVPNLEPPA